jgi:osmotically-inducible protein OsmY
MATQDLSTDTLVRRARARLRECAYRELRHIRCECEGATLILHGRVPSYFLKQFATTVVRQTEGVERVENQLVVARSLSFRDAGPEPG